MRNLRSRIMKESSKRMNNIQPIKIQAPERMFELKLKKFAVNNMNETSFEKGLIRKA